MPVRLANNQLALNSAIDFNATVDNITLGDPGNITIDGSKMHSASTFKGVIDSNPTIVIADGVTATIPGIGNVDPLKTPVIKVGENSTVTIRNILSPLRFEISTGGVVDNLHITDVPSTVVLGENSVATITGENMNFDQVVLGSKSQLNLMRDGVLFHMNPGVLAADLVIQNIHLLADLCGFLNQQNFSAEGFHLPLEHTHSLRLYSENKELMKMMFAQNQGVDKPIDLDTYIKDNFFEINAISLNAEGLNANLPACMLGEITSYLE